MRSFVVAVLAVLALAMPVMADETREAQGYVYNEATRQWVGPNPANNFLRDPRYTDVQAPGGDAGSGAAGASSGGASSSSTGGNGGGNGCSR